MMIPVKESAIETFIAMAERDSDEYFKRLADEVSKENRPLYIAMVNNAKKVVQSLDTEEYGPVADVIKRHVFVNMVSAGLALYHVIDMQLEANELEKIYGEVEARG